jgi:hypothetical protein
VNVEPLIEYWNATAAGAAVAFDGTAAVRVTDVPTTCGDAGVALVMTIVVPVFPVMTLKGNAALVYAWSVWLPEYTASK